MTPSGQAKAAGLKSIAEAAEMINKPPTTLFNWFRLNHDLFCVVIAGCAAVKQQKENPSEHD